MARVRPSVRMSIQVSVCFLVIQVKMMMRVRGEFRRRHPSMRVIVSVCVDRLRVDLMSGRGQHAILPGVREAHLDRAHDTRPFHGQFEFRLGRVSEPAIAFGQASAYHHRLEDL